MILILFLASSFLPDYAKAKLSIVKILQLFDRIPQIDNWNTDVGIKLDSIDGDIQFKSVEFFYPTRTEVKVLDNFELRIKQGQQIALVGGSGCGKTKFTSIEYLQKHCHCSLYSS